MRFIHTADWHPHSMGTVGGKLVIDPSTGLSITLTDFQRSLDFLFSTIQAEGVKLLLVAGDVFDSHQPSMDELRVVMEFFERCSDEGIVVVVIVGNHDIGQNSFLASALAPVQFLSIFVKEKPETVLLDIGGESVRIDCLPYPSRGRLTATMQDKKTCTPEELTAFINRGLYNILQGFQVDTQPADHKILLAHGSVESAIVGEQPRTLAHDVFIPVLNVETFYDYIALGHIHQTQAIGEKTMYSGSLLRQSFGEEKERKGFLLCELREGVLQTSHIENPHARVYKTLTMADMEGMVGDPDPSIVYRIKDAVQEHDLSVAMPQIRTFMQQQDFCQIDVEVLKDARTRDAQVTDQLNSTQALERCLEKDGIEDPQLSLCRQLHLELVEEVTR